MVKERKSGLSRPINRKLEGYLTLGLGLGLSIIGFAFGREVGYESGRKEVLDRLEVYQTQKREPLTRIFPDSIITNYPTQERITNYSK